MKDYFAAWESLWCVDRGVRWVRTHPPPHGPKRSACKKPKTKEKNAKDNYFLLNLPMNVAFYSVENISEVNDHLI